MSADLQNREWGATSTQAANPGGAGANAQRPRILFATLVSPFSAKSGAEQRSALLHDALCRVGVVDVVQIDHGEADHVWQEEGSNHVLWRVQVIRANWELGRYRPKRSLTLELERRLARPLASYDLIVGRYLWAACQLLLPAGVPTLVDLDDYRFRYAPGTGWWPPAAWAQRVGKYLAHRMGRRQLPRFDAAIVLSERDRREVQALPTVFVPNVPYCSPAVLGATPMRKRLLFVGSLWYGPNADGVRWFLKWIWPTVHRAHPDATLQLVGAAAEAVRTAWQEVPGVTAPGFVDDLALEYGRAALVIVPVQSGGGTNIKVLEAMAYGRPVLGTGFVASAFGEAFTPGVDWLVAKDARGFAATLCDALAGRIDLEIIGRNGQAAVQMHFSAERNRQTLTAAAASLLRRTRYEPPDRP